MNPTFKSLLITTALGIGLGTITGAHAQGDIKNAGSVIDRQTTPAFKRTDLAVREVRVMHVTGAPVPNPSKLPKGTQLTVVATLVNVGMLQTPACKVRLTNTTDPNTQAVPVPALPAGGSFVATFPTPTRVNGAAGTTGTIQVEANFDAGLSPYGRWFQEAGYTNNVGTFSYQVQ